MEDRKYIFITGGVISSLGKGIVASSLGSILENMGYNVSIMKCDPYINMDPGTMNPKQHGEVYVTEDGAETDLDVGHYERFLNKNLSGKHSITAGQIYWSVLNKERKGEYLGATIQVVPHITNEIKNKIKGVGEQDKSDILIVEIGGTVGDIEGLPFIEAIRQIKNDVGKDNVLYVHATYLPYIKTADELKTKPSQHSYKELKGLGITPNIMVCRSSNPVPQEQKDKISLFCDVDKEAVISIPDADTIYRVPLIMNEQKLDKLVVDYLGLKPHRSNLQPIRDLVHKIETADKEVNVAMVGKYIGGDAYLSVEKSLQHAAYSLGHKVKIHWINAEDFDAKKMDKSWGILVPGGFGSRGQSGKLDSITYAREEKIPFFGICLGLQMAAIEFARSVLNLSDANSTEFDPETSDPIIHIMEDQKNVDTKGGTMRLGSYPCILTDGSKTKELYGTKEITERHRHRYEFNNKYREMLEEKGLKIVGTSPDNNLVEIIELEDHPFFIAGQFHPEFKTRPTNPHPLFVGFIQSIIDKEK